MSIDSLALTGNVLLVWDSGTIAAYRLTEDGSVDGVSIGRRAGRDDSIWTLSLSDKPRFSLGDQTVAIGQNGKVVRVYRAETGEALEPTQTVYYHDYSFEDMPCDLRDLHYYKTLIHHEILLNRRGYSSWDMLCGLHHPDYHDAYSDLISGWVRDPEGKYQLWIPVEWRNPKNEGALFDNRKTLRVDLEDGGTILIKF